jgi:hypothetical protein
MSVKIARLLVHAGGLNLGLLMRTLFGVGTPRGLQGRAAALFAALWSLLWHPATAFTLIWSGRESPIVLIDLQRPRNVRGITVPLKNAFVAVGTAVTRRPPHRSVRAGLLHTAPTLDEWRRSARSAADAGYGRWEAIA